MQPEFTVKLNEQMWNGILELLSSCPAPLKMTYPLVQAITLQLQAQKDAATGTPGA